MFPKQHDLIRAGIDIKGRGAILRQNYRNTKQILKSAFSIIREFSKLAAIPKADIIPPEYAFRDGTLPSIYKCATHMEQLDWLFAMLSLIDSQLDSVCICSSRTQSLIDVEERSRLRGIDTYRLTGDDKYLPTGLKLSTLENVKGHEFSVVFLLDLSDSELPSRSFPYGELGLLFRSGSIDLSFIGFPFR